MLVEIANGPLLLLVSPLGVTGASVDNAENVFLSRIAAMKEFDFGASSRSTQCPRNRTSVRVNTPT